MIRSISGCLHARKEITDDRKDFKSGGHLLYTPWLEEDSEQMTSASGAWQRNRQAHRERRRGKNITGKGNSISKDPPSVVFRNRKEASGARKQSLRYIV